MSPSPKNAPDMPSGKDQYGQLKDRYAWLQECVDSVRENMRLGDWNKLNLDEVMHFL